MDNRTEKRILEEYAKAKASGEMDFSSIKKKLKEVHDIPESEITDWINRIEKEALQYHSESNQNQKLSAVIFMLGGLGMLTFSIYGMIYPSKGSLSNTLNYLGIFLGVYLIIRNIKRFKS